MIWTNGIQEEIRKILNTDTITLEAVAGGCINEAYKVITSHKQVFLKINSASKFPSLFYKEQHGLLLLAQSNSIYIPKVINVIETAGYQVLILEWINKSDLDHLFWTRFGEQLAIMHEASMPYFGLVEDNYMGSVPQVNTPKGTWYQFFKENRLEPILNKCIAGNLLPPHYSDKLAKLFTRLPDLFDKGPSSLVHGDL